MTGPLLAMLLSCTQPAQTPTQESQLDAATLLDRVEKIITQLPFEPALVGVMLGIDLDKASNSTQYFDVYRGIGTGVLRAVEVRSPTAATPTKGGMVLLELGDDCIDESAVGQRFGTKQPGPRSIPRPTAPGGQPRYDIYSQSWGAIRLGYTPDSGCLVSIVLDATN